jgi:low temperature requirement protein LtrA
MSDDPTWCGIGHGLLILAALWWAWAAYAWLTNALDPDEGVVRLAMLAAMTSVLLVALAVPEAFGDAGILFGVAYMVVRLLHLVLYMIAGRQDRDLLGAVLRMLPTSTLGPPLLIIAGALDGDAQAVLWMGALTIDYLGVLIGRGRGLQVSPVHFAERHRLIVIVALGESIVAIGIGAAGLPLTAGVVTAAVLGMAAIAALWWAYFDVIAITAERYLAQISGVARATVARDYYSYLHLPMIAGVVLFAMGLKKTLEQVGDPLDTVPAAALSGGLALYFCTHVAMRIRLVLSIRRTTSDRPGWFGPGRTIAALACLALVPATREVPALIALSLLAGVCCSLIVYDVVHYREDRDRVRHGLEMPRGTGRAR